MFITVLRFRMVIIKEKGGGLKEDYFGEAFVVVYAKRKILVNGEHPLAKFFYRVEWYSVAHMLSRRPWRISL